MHTILILLIAALLFGLWLTRPLRAVAFSTSNDDFTALYAQLESMERSLDATDRQLQKEQRQFRRELKKQNNEEQPPAPKRQLQPRKPRLNTNSESIKSPHPDQSPAFTSLLTIAPLKPRINLFSTCTRFLRITANYAISLLRPLFQLPRTFTNFFTRPPTPKPTPTINPAA